MKPRDIAAIRKVLGMTQEAFGKALGFVHGQRRISELELGVRPITRKTEKLAEFIDRAGKK